jgi:ribonuclease HI
MFDDNALNIYTDGSSYSSPRRGGIGIRFVFPCFMNKGELDFDFDGYKCATSNQMELKACITALQEVSHLSEINFVSRIIIHTDSCYVVDNYKRAVYSWSRNKWGKSTGAPVLNAELWKELLKNVRKIRKRVDIEWVKGHSKNEHNKAVDKLAKKSANNATKSLTGFVDVRRKLSNKHVEIGSVKMLGQMMSIRIITSQYLEVQKIWKYKYEVVSKKSVFYKYVDIIYYRDVLRVGHVYLVRFNKNSDYPQITNVFREIEKSQPEMDKIG